MLIVSINTFNRGSNNAIHSSTNIPFFPLIFIIVFRRAVGWGIEYFIQRFSIEHSNTQESDPRRYTLQQKIEWGFNGIEAANERGTGKRFGRRRDSLFNTRSSKRGVKNACRTGNPRCTNVVR